MRVRERLLRHLSAVVAIVMGYMPHARLARGTVLLVTVRVREGIGGFGLHAVLWSPSFVPRFRPCPLLFDAVVC